MQRRIALFLFHLVRFFFPIQQHSHPLLIQLLCRVDARQLRLVIRCGSDVRSRIQFSLKCVKCRLQC